MQQIHRTGETVRESQTQYETARDMQQLHGSRKGSNRQPATIGDSERHAATPWDQRNSEGQPTTIEANERQPATTGESERHTTL